ncbi:phosphatidate phosphatase APP1 [Flavobacterium sp. 7E]|uniref:App1 family protein n=1 Tax=Flavobacterium sp. 7E TaxID=2735898 RepID=UPI00156FDAC5|nr:App1 family protein [Flavobacterium sp. 7E]NRS90018.1 phosphatidate phosphatase APP1 [Flavobacterium sp. 7E]
MKPILKLYRGYANEQELIVMGHVFKPTTMKDYDFLSTNFKNAGSVINMYRIKTDGNADVYLKYNDTEIHTKTLHDGYFKFSIPIKSSSDYGWMDYEVSIIYQKQRITSRASYIKPYKGDLGIISDIDDTFLVSYTLNPLKKLYHLLFRNVNSRKIFEDVTAHYQALSEAGRTNNKEKNAFFYVSSSEWNLYRFLVKFTEIHNLPKAVLLLKDIKTSLTNFLWSGRGEHNHKFEKIKHILEFYPDLQYVLMGDDSQHDPYLYESISKIFPLTVKAIYIRQTGKKKKKKVLDTLTNIASLNVSICYFKSSAEAIAHSKEIGLIK